VVSGRSTAIIPVPSAASDLSCSMAEKSLVKDVASTSPPDDAPVVVVAESLLGESSPHATNPTSATITMAALAARLSETFMLLPPCVIDRGGRVDIGVVTRIDHVAARGDARSSTAACNLRRRA
jgi:hypothetical protein